MVQGVQGVCRGTGERPYKCDSPGVVKSAITHTETIANQEDRLQLQPSKSAPNDCPLQSSLTNKNQMVWLPHSIHRLLLCI